MIRLRLKNVNHDVKDDFLALPGAQPLTLHEVDSENLPYACQCPLCGGLFELPTGVLYEIKDDTLEDGESGLTPEGPADSGEGDTGGFFDMSDDVGGPPDMMGEGSSMPEE